MPSQEDVQRLGDDADHQHHRQRGDHQQEQIAPADRALVEPCHALGVDQHRPDPQAGEEGRRHAGPALVEELDHRVVGADGDDELGPALVGQEHGGILARALDDELDVLLAELLELLVAGVPAVGVDVVDVLGADVHRPQRTPSRSRPRMMSG